VSVAARLDQFREPLHEPRWHRQSATETEKAMLRHLADELRERGVDIGHDVYVDTRRHLPIARPDVDGIPRPATRGDCEPCPTCQAWRDRDPEDPAAGAFPGELACGHAFAQAIARSRPCVFVLCRHTLFVDVHEATGHAAFNFPGLEADEVGSPTCSLDEADKGGLTLAEVGEAIRVTRERTRQIEVRGLDAIRDHRGGVSLPPAREDGVAVHMRRARGRGADG